MAPQRILGIFCNICNDKKDGAPSLLNFKASVTPLLILLSCLFHFKVPALGSVSAVSCERRGTLQY